MVNEMTLYVVHYFLVILMKNMNTTLKHVNCIFNSQMFLKVSFEYNIEYYYARASVCRL